MFKKVKTLLVLMLAIVMMTGNIMEVYAEEFDEANMKLVDEYIENGVHITVYEIISDRSEIMPRFPVYKEMVITVEFNGWGTPPSTYSYTVDEDPDYKTRMSGTLYLISSKKYTNALKEKKTEAVYKGTISGNI